MATGLPRSHVAGECPAVGLDVEPGRAEAQQP